MADNGVRDKRKAANEARRTELGDEINLRSAELSRLADEYEEIVDEESAEAAAAGFIKLYEVPRETWVSLSRHPSSLFFFDHIDGMYSYCLTIQGELVHVSASTLVLVHDIDIDNPEAPPSTPGQYRTS